VPITLSPPWQDLTFMSPLSQQRADRLVEFLSEELSGTVLDVGCGWAELLLQVVAAAPACNGLGLDLDGTAIDHGRELAVARGLGGRVALKSADAAAGLPDHADAVISIGATHVWAPPAGEAIEPLHYARALRRIRSVVRRGARVVFADGIWSQPPTTVAVEALGGRLDELVTIGELMAIATAAGFAAYGVHEAGLDEWDAFESGYGACYARWLAEHPAEGSDAEEVRGRARRQQNGYLTGYRSILGLAYLELIAI
jgi:SAM-dependent methyltransferase